MKITVNFESLDEFETYFGEQDEASQLTFELHQKIDKLNEQLKAIESKMEQ